MKYLGTEYNCYLTPVLGANGCHLPRDKNGLLGHMHQLKKTFQGVPFIVYVCEAHAKKHEHTPGEEIV